MPQRHSNNQIAAALGVSMFHATVFGPQSQWSSLLGQREHLQDEIAHGTKYLGQLRKDLTECGAPVRAWPRTTQPSRRHARLDRTGASALSGNIEQFLSAWLEQLQERLTAVNREIAALESKNETEPVFPEESMLALLRAAG